MYKIFLPTEKRQATARGFWYNADGKKYRDFIRFTYTEKISVKLLKDFCRQYKQEAIFVESVNNKTGKKNRAYCFNANGTKEVFNRRITYYADTKRDLIKYIQLFKRKGFNCYTIEKELIGEYSIFTWTKRQDKKRRVLKRNELIKKLCRKYENTICKDGLHLNYRIQDNARIGGRFTQKYYTKKITITPYIIKHYRINSGYSNTTDYYKNRGNKINPYILHNYKNCLRFVILHELGHAYFYNKYTHYKKAYKWYDNQILREKYADLFALRYLKKLNIKIKGSDLNEK